MPSNSTHLYATACNRSYAHFIGSTHLILLQAMVGKLLHIYLVGTRTDVLGTPLVSNQCRLPEQAMRVQLTDRFCQHAKSRTAQTDYVDETVTGLALRVTAGGVKAWTLLHGTPRRRIT